MPPVTDDSPSESTSAETAAMVDSNNMRRCFQLQLLPMKQPEVCQSPHAAHESQENFPSYTKG